MFSIQTLFRLNLTKKSYVIEVWWTHIQLGANFGVQEG